MTRSLGAKIVAIFLGASLVAACGSDSDDGDSGTTGGKVELSFWAWAPNIEKVIDKWNAANPDIHVTLSRQAGGGDIVTKLLTAHKAGNPPDLAQVEYQSLPTLVSNDVLADIAKETGDT
jgi:multiple sugar transport system substrate-binding protein